MITLLNAAVILAFTFRKRFRLAHTNNSCICKSLYIEYIRLANCSLSNTNAFGRATLLCNDEAIV